MTATQSYSVTVPLVMALLVALPLVSSTTVGGLPPGAGGSTRSELLVADQTLEGAVDFHPHLIGSCLRGDIPFSDAYDPSAGYVYVSTGSVISIVKPPCEVIKSITLGAGSGNVGGVSYDPLTREIVAIDQASAVAYVIHGLSLVKTVSLGGADHCPFSAGWDGALAAVLVTDVCGGVDLLYLTDVNGGTRAAVILDAFDQGNSPTAVLAADGYVFAAGNRVNVYNDRTLRFVGSFGVSSEGIVSPDPIAWDPLNKTVVLAGSPSSLDHVVVLFLSANSIAKGLFTYGYLYPHDILNYAIGGVAFSTTNHDVYLTAAGGNDVWELAPSGTMTHTYLQSGDSGLYGVAYDSSNRDMYVCGLSLYVVS